MFCKGKGPFHWASLVGSKEDIYTLDDVILEEFSYNKGLCRWIQKAKARKIAKEKGIKMPMLE
ncbi:MAG: hypothetical protein ACUVUF_07785 [Candidatus Bathycorpusculaceae bacterium]